MSEPLPVTALSVDVVKFIRAQCESIQRHYDSAYPLNSIDTDEAHASLGAILQRNQAIIDLLDSLAFVQPTSITLKK